MQPIDRWSQFAALRFGLALIVVVTHLGERLPIGWMQGIAALGGFEAVLGFLAISGYSVQVSQSRHPDGFLLRRLLRIYPVYLTCLLLTVSARINLDHLPMPSEWALLWNGLLLNQFLTQTSLLPAAWSLSLEFSFYLMLPLIAGWQDRTLQRVCRASFACFLLYTLGRTLAHFPYFAGLGFGANFPLLAFAWLQGVRLAKEGDGRQRVITELAWMFAGYLSLTALLELGHRIKRGTASGFLTVYVPEMALQALTLAVVIVVLRVAARPSARSGKAMPRGWMLWLGDLSYPLYLVHLAVFIALQALGLHQAAPMLLIAVAVAAVLHHGLERPLQRWRPKPRPRLASSPDRLGGQAL